MGPKFRQGLYTLGVVVFAGLSVLSTFKVIDPSVASSVSAALTAVLGLFGVTVAGTAAYNINKQQQDGTFEPPKQVSPEQAVIDGINEVLRNQKSAQDAVEKVKDAVSVAVRDVPVLGPLAQQAIDSLPK